MLGDLERRSGLGSILDAGLRRRRTGRRQAIIARGVPVELVPRLTEGRALGLAGTFAHAAVERIEHLLVPHADRIIPGEPVEKLGAVRATAALPLDAPELVAVGVHLAVLPLIHAAVARPR